MSYICFMDLNDFGDINNRYGHVEGDLAIVYFGFLVMDLLNKTWKSDEFRFARYAGDEFVLVINERASELAELKLSDFLCKTMHDTLAQCPFKTRNGDTHQLSVACGVVRDGAPDLGRHTRAAYREEREGMLSRDAVLITAADRAMYFSKGLIKNGILLDKQDRSVCPRGAIVTTEWSRPDSIQSYSELQVKKGKITGNKRKENEFKAQMLSCLYDYAEKYKETMFSKFAISEARAEVAAE